MTQLWPKAGVKLAEDKTLPQEAQWLPPLCPFEQQEASRDASETSLCCPVAPFLSLISVCPQIVQVLTVYPSETQVGERVSDTKEWFVQAESSPSRKVNPLAVA